MMSRAVVLLWVVGAWPDAARAEAPELGSAEVPIELVASFFARYELRENYDQVGLADLDVVRYRSRLGVVYGPAELGYFAVTLRFVPQASGTWHVGGDDLVDADLGLHEGAMELQHGATRLEAGRFEMAYGDHLVIGSVGWHPTGRAFDGLRLHWQPAADGPFVDAFATIVGEGTSTPGDAALAAGDTYFAGIYSGLGSLWAQGLALDAYALLLTTMAETGLAGDPPVATEREGSARFTLGARAKQRVGAIDYRAEAGLQLGSATNDRAIVAWQADAELGVSVLDDRLRIAAGGLYASGDDPGSTDTDEGYAQLFPTAHKWLGLSDVIGGRTNIASVALYVSARPARTLTLYVDGHMFVRPEDVIVPDPADPTMFTRTEAGLAGFEADVGAAHTLGEGLVARTNYSIFLPDEGRYGTSDPVHFWELELRYER